MNHLMNLGNPCLHSDSTTRATDLKIDRYNFFNISKMFTVCLEHFEY